jgi:CheY-like chemotaxis protein
MTKQANKIVIHNKRNTLGMSEQVYKQLLIKLETVNGTNPQKTSTARIFTRLEYLDPFLEIMLETTDRSQNTITVASRNISRGGMSVLHSSFIYPGTVVNAKLSRTDDSCYHARGSVIRCEHRGGVVHEIGIRFDTEIVVQEFIRPDINESIKTLESVTPENLNGKMIIVGNDPTIMPFIREYLQETSINYGFAETAKDALEKDVNDYQLIFVCMDAGNMSGPEFTKHLREIGYRKPIILSGQSHDELSKQQVRLSNADLFLPVPFDENALLCALGEYLISQWSEKTLETVRSGVDRETVNLLRVEVAKLGVLLDQQIRTDDPILVYATCTKIRSIAPLLGMKSLRDLTLKVGDEVANSGDLSKHQDQLADIKLICTSMGKAA